MPPSDVSARPGAATDSKNFVRSIFLAPAGAAMSVLPAASTRSDARPVPPSANCTRLISAARNSPLSTHRSSTIGLSAGGLSSSEPSVSPSMPEVASPPIFDIACTRRLPCSYALTVDVVTIRCVLSLSSRTTSAPSIRLCALAFNSAATCSFCAGSTLGVTLPATPPPNFCRSVTEIETQPPSTRVSTPSIAAPISLRMSSTSALDAPNFAASSAIGAFTYATWSTTRTSTPATPSMTALIEARSSVTPSPPLSQPKENEEL